MVVFGQKLMYWDNSACIRAKVVEFVQNLLFSAKLVVFGESCCFRAKVVLFRQSGCIWAKGGSIRANFQFPRIVPLLPEYNNFARI